MSTINGVSGAVRARHSGRWRSGQVILVGAVTLPVLVAFMGLSVDVGFLYHLKRRMQHAADAGALGGAYELARRSPTRVIAAAKNDTKINGFDDARADITVTVNNPPASGPWAGDNRFVEVILDQKAPTFFLHLVSSESAGVRARAVAGLVASFDFCVLALNPAARGALTSDGGATLNAGCGVMVNSTDYRAIIMNGSGCIYSDEVGVSGDYVMNGSANCIEPYPPVTAVPPAMDPLEYLVEPTAPFPLPLAIGLSIPSGATAVLVPGVYQGGIQINGANVTFLPGTYILNGGGLVVDGNSVISGAGVTFYNTNTGAPGAWGDITITGLVTATLSAPTSGDYAGMLFWNDPNAPDRNPGSRILGTPTSVFEGAMYFPSTHLTYGGTSTLSAWTTIIADTVTFSGNAQLASNFPLSAVPPPARKATLVE